MPELPEHPLAAIAHAKQLLTRAADEYRAAVALGRDLEDTQSVLHEAADAVTVASRSVQADAVDLIISAADGDWSGQLYAGLVAYVADPDADDEEDDR